MKTEKLLNHILDENHTALMETFDALMVEKITALLEDRRKSIAQSIFEDEGGRGREHDDDDDDCDDDDDHHHDDDDDSDVDDEDEDKFDPFSNIPGGE